MQKSKWATRANKYIYMYLQPKKRLLEADIFKLQMNISQCEVYLQGGAVKLGRITQKKKTRTY